jgi:predicted membrane chloride channel (bestrophin family)
MMEGKKMASYKKDFEVAMFFSTQTIDFHFYLKRLLELFFFSPFSIVSLSLSLFQCFVSLRTWGL